MPKEIYVRKKDDPDRHRQSDGIKESEREKKVSGTPTGFDLHEKIYPLRVINPLNIRDTAKLPHGDPSD